MQLTKSDLAILNILQHEGRLSNIAVGERVGLSHSAVARRIEALERGGVIRGYRVILDRSKIDLRETVLVLVQLKAHGDDSTSQFEAEINAHLPNVIESFKLSGSWDYILKFAVRDMAHFEQVHAKLAAMRQIKLLRSLPVFGFAEAPLPLALR